MVSKVNCVADLLTEDAHLIVAFASLEGDMVDQHFGSSQGFFVYNVDARDVSLIASKAFPREAKDGNEAKLKPKMSWLVGCDVVYCGSIGESATRQLIGLGITPMKVSGGPDVEDLIETIQNQLKGSPEFWLANILKKKHRADADITRFSEAEDDWG